MFKLQDQERANTGGRRVDPPAPLQAPARQTRNVSNSRSRHVDPPAPPRAPAAQTPIVSAPRSRRVDPPAPLHAPTSPTNATPGSLKAAAPRIISWHIFNFSEGTTSEDIAQYTETVLNIQQFQCEQLKVTRGNYTSFRLDVPATATSIIKHPSSWPEGVTVRRFQIVTSKNSQHNAVRTTRK
ncbi:hypothetical protein O0L34_g19383 [Tuta absoluta]|nr:hypothetical protein O0L34_g19383 [Tuta absoluta]